MVRQLFSKKNEMFSNRLLTVKNVSLIHEETNYNIPMFYLKECVFTTSDFNTVLTFYMLKLTDINYSTDKNETILSIFLEKLLLIPKNEQDTYKNRLFIRILIEMGYNIRKFKIEYDGKLKTYNSVSKLLGDDISNIIDTFIDQTEVEDLPDGNFKSGDFGTVSLLTSNTSYGELYITENLKNKREYVIKYPKSEDEKERTDYSDIYKDIIFAKYIESINPNLAIKTYGYYESKSRGIEAVVMEWGAFTLENVLDNIINLHMSLKRKFLKRIFKELTEKFRDLNEMGIIHFDLKPSNILVLGDMSLRIIDFGLTCFVGIERNKFSYFKETSAVKAPDDTSDKKAKVYKTSGKEVFYDSFDVTSINYSTDMFSIASILFNALIKGNNAFPYQCLLTGSKMYKYQKGSIDGDICNYTMKVVTAEEINEIESFSEHSIDFFVRTLTHDSRMRLVCSEALKHPLFTNGSMEVNIPTPYSIFDIPNFSSATERMTEEFTPIEIINRSNELKILDKFYQLTSKVELPSNNEASIIDNLGNYSFIDNNGPTIDTITNLILLREMIPIGNKTDIEKNFETIFIGRGLEMGFNYLEYFKTFFSPIKEYQEPYLKHFYQFMLDKKFTMIFPSSLMRVFVTLKRIESVETGYDIALFSNLIYYIFSRIITSFRPHSIVLYRLFEIIFLYLKNFAIHATSPIYVLVGILGLKENEIWVAEILMLFARQIGAMKRNRKGDYWK